MDIILVQALIIVIILLGTIFLMSQKKGKWAINTKRVDCPRCASEMPSVRMPTSTKQAMWGGWTCQKCGSELDKFGNLIDENNQKEQTKNYIAINYGIDTPPVEPFDSNNKTPIERVFDQKQKR